MSKEEQDNPDRVLFVISNCYVPEAARILELAGSRVQNAFKADPSSVEEWVEFNLAQGADGRGVFVWSGRWNDKEERAVRRPTSAEWHRLMNGEELWSGKASDPEGMAFEIMRTSHRNAGWVGENATVQPVDGAVLNSDERRWELRLRTLEELATLGREAKLLFCFSDAEGDLPVIEILDDDDLTE